MEKLQTDKSHLGIIVLERGLALEIVNKLDEMLQCFFDVTRTTASHPKISKFLLAKDRIHKILLGGIVQEELNTDESDIGVDRKPPL